MVYFHRRHCLNHPRSVDTSPICVFLSFWLPFTSFNSPARTNQPSIVIVSWPGRSLGTRIKRVVGVGWFEGGEGGGVLGVGGLEGVVRVGGLEGGRGWWVTVYLYFVTA